jgi:hypothetical protein
MAHDHEIYMTLADTAVELRDADALRSYAPALETLARRDDHKLYLAIAHRALGVAHHLAGEHASARSLLMQALELFTGLGARWQMGRTLFELGELRSSSMEARYYYAQALVMFEEIRAAPHAERTRQALNALS